MIDETDFWARLEFRICAEFHGFEYEHLRWYWCDGLVAEQYDLLSKDPCIRGRAWRGPSGQETWRFVLLLDTATHFARGGRLVSTASRRPGDGMAVTRPAEQAHDNRSSLQLPGRSLSILICRWSVMP